MITKIENCHLFGFNTIHSNKTNKDYYKINLCVEGNFCAFVVPKSKGEDLKKKKPFADVEKTHNPSSCKISLRLDFSERGVYTSLEDVE